ncbi:hypothetical protein B0H16DRAFT_1448478 [Mycena metata]|uniref:Uncharacterized protein n=1 Tax=Mycena metata TaxID=1033252 RepID=A0AAD7K613_9AGAR|nr:hypothetical protein B0H16DRAFT_1448478 [Mycena metata]
MASKEGESSLKSSGGRTGWDDAWQRSEANPPGFICTSEGLPHPEVRNLDGTRERPWKLFEYHSPTIQPKMPRIVSSFHSQSHAGNEPFNSSEEFQEQAPRTRQLQDPGARRERAIFAYGAASVPSLRAPRAGSELLRKLALVAGKHLVKEVVVIALESCLELVSKAEGKVEIIVGFEIWLTSDVLTPAVGRKEFRAARSATPRVRGNIQWEKGALLLAVRDSPKPSTTTTKSAVGLRTKSKGDGQWLIISF